MNKYRSHLCSDLSIKNLSEKVILSGWADTIRDHGNLLFIDLRDNYGITQCVIDGTHSLFEEISKLSNESVLTISGEVVKRSDETINKNLQTGEIEIKIQDYKILSKSEILKIVSCKRENLFCEVKDIYCFGKLALDNGHNLVPDPPHKKWNAII